MARFLFVAHDPGGALMLSAAAPEARHRGHAVVFAASGAAERLWREQGYAVSTVSHIAEFKIEAGHEFDAVATGTGFSAYERNVWPWARERDIPTLALVDAWTNLGRRFQADDGMTWPAAVAVIDQALANELTADVGFPGLVRIVGQPHLQRQTEDLIERRRRDAGKDGERRSRCVVFFSEPVREDYGDQRGYDQFSVFEHLATRMPDAADVTLLVKAHPREDQAKWTKLLNDFNAEIADGSAADLLAAADGVVGMTTMVLVEAHLAGIPVLSVQPGRTFNANPIVDEICPVVTQGTDIPAAWQVFLDDMGRSIEVGTRFTQILDVADVRTIDALEAAAAIRSAE